MKIAFQGDHGAYSEQAVLQYAPKARPIPCQSFEILIEKVQNQHCDLGMLPIENSTAGSVIPAYDALINSKVSVIGEVVLPIHHCLLGTQNAELQQIQQAQSHPQALAQCAGFLKSRDIEAQPAFDTAGSAKLLSQNPNPHTAAIASELAATHYGLKILQRNIEDLEGNQTRFLVLSTTALPLEKLQRTPIKSCCIFSLKHEQGALSKILHQLDQAGANLLKLESRPNRIQPFCYQFMIDFEMQDVQALSTLQSELKKSTRELRWLGSF